MIKTDSRAPRICPCCGRAYRGVPALSRMDCRTLICPDCGTRQALAGLGIAPEEQERILRIVHRHEKAAAAEG